MKIDKAFIFGCADLGQLLYMNLASQGKEELLAFVLDDVFYKGEGTLPLPIIPMSEARRLFSPRDVGAYVALGYSGMNQHRARAFAELKKAGYKILDFRHPSATVNAESQGEGNLFFQNVLVDYFCVVGSGNIFYPNSMLAHHSHIGGFNFFAVSSCVAGHVTMGDYNFIGANATVRNHIELKHACLVGAGAYLDRSLESGQVFVPARGSILAKKSCDCL